MAHTRLMLVAAAALASTGCLPLIMGPNNFRPGGEIGSCSNAAGFSVELARPLSWGLGTGTSPTSVASDVVWFGQDVGLQLAVSERVALEGQLKLASLVPFFLPLPIGAAGGARATLVPQSDGRGFGLDAALRLGGASADNVDFDLKESTEVNVWALGGELHVPATYRFARWFSLTGAPFLRVYRVHSDATQGGAAEDATLTEAGASLSLELKVDRFVFAPALSLSRVWTHGESGWAPPAPGLFLGARW